MVPFPTFPLLFQSFTFFYLVAVGIVNVEGYTDLDSPLVFSEPELCSLLAGNLPFIFIGPALESERNGIIFFLFRMSR